MDRHSRCRLRRNRRGTHRGCRRGTSTGDPKGGNTAFLVGGSVGVGKILTFINAETGVVLDEIVNGRGIDPDRLVTCEFLFEDTEIPGVGLIDLLFRVEALITPQGR